MISCRVQEDADDPGRAVELTLEGRKICAYEMRWDETLKRWHVNDTPYAKALWNFDLHAVEVAEKAFGKVLADMADRMFGEHMRSLDRPRQGGLLGEVQCSVCGTDRETFPETAVHDGRGNVWAAPDEPLQWQCHVCGRYVCRRCTLVRDDLGQYYFHTYCSEACRQAAPRSFADDDEVMSC